MTPTANDALAHATQSARRLPRTGGAALVLASGLPAAECANLPWRAITTRFGSFRLILPSTTFMCRLLAECSTKCAAGPFSVIARGSATAMGAVNQVFYRKSLNHERARHLRGRYGRVTGVAVLRAFRDDMMQMAHSLCQPDAGVCNCC